MLELIDAYIAQQDIAGQLANFDAHFTPPHGECFLALADDSPVGIVMIRPNGTGVCELNRMYVAPEARGLGIGRRLCLMAVDEARALGYQTVVLSALYRHVEALPLYESLGFIRCQPPSGYDPDDERYIHMRLDFGPPDSAGGRI
ncbi:MAG: GNAT family N-acetyltransferase [Rhodobacter sp.]|nr:GNAT family N-acetyltransferase [Rhodobacter sp.]